MKTFALLSTLVFFAQESQNMLINDETKDEVFIGVYDGLTENMEFQFTDSKGQVYLFDEIAKDLEFDLYDEMNFGKKFKVSWEERNVEILDDENEPTGETKKIKVITGLQKA